MSYKFLVCFFILFSLKAFSETFTSKLQEIADGANSEKILLFENGRIAWIKGDLISNATILPGKWYHVLTNENVEIEKIAGFEIQKQELEINPSFSNENQYRVDILTRKVAQVINSKLEPFSSTTASSDRSHLWAYQLYQEFDLKASKFFLFPSLDQIKKDKLKFWYYVGLNIKDEKGASILFDPNLSTEVLSFSSWINTMIKNTDDCRLESIHSFEINKNKCQIIELNMFYRRPIDILRLQIHEFSRSHFYDFEIEESRFSIFFPG